MTKLILMLGAMALTLLTGCVEADHEFSKLAPGIWRATLTLEDKVIISAGDDNMPILQDNIELPFTFEVKYATRDSFYIELINGEERIIVDDIFYGRDMAVAKDTLLIKFPVFDTYIKAIYVENVLQGEWVVNYREKYRIPFVAYHGQAHRFQTDGIPADQDISGRWHTVFDRDTEDEYPAIGVFKQDGNHLSGTFLTETGDYRYLDGMVRANKFFLSCFDGSHAFLFQGKVMDDGKLLGTFFSGNHYKGLFESERNEDYELSSPFDMTLPVNNQEPLAFSFPNSDGDMVSLADPQYDGKVKIVKIMGTWCPNCKDQTDYLINYLKEEDPENVEVIALSFERYRNDSKGMEAIKTFKSRFEVPYPVLYGGYYDKAEASQKIPQISQILSYPTLLFVDKNNLIRHIHTGFAGPATDEYKIFNREFKKIINELSAE